eukprot:scaffold5574_cov126-Isochrysis_galbana.AAC.5
MVGPRGRPAASTRGSVVNTLPGPGKVEQSWACAHICLVSKAQPLPKNSLSRSNPCSSAIAEQSASFGACETGRTTVIDLAMVRHPPASLPTVPRALLAGHSLS